MVKIVLTGPESTGKTTLARQLAEQLNGVYLPEYARHYLEANGPNYKQEDLLKIAEGQYLQEQKAQKENPDFLICDTSFLVIKVWSEYKYGTCSPLILDLLKQSVPSIYFLCGVDVPWHFDVLRENPDDRAQLYQIYLNELHSMNVPFRELSGSVERRLEEASAVAASGLFK